MIKFSTKKAFMVLFGYIFVGVLIQGLMTVWDIQARDKLLKRLNIDDALVSKYAEIDEIITNLHYDILRVNDYESKKELYVKVANARRLYQDLKNTSVREEHTQATSTQMKVQQISDMQASLDKIISRKNMDYDFKQNRAITQLKRQTEWLQVFRESERAILAKDIAKYSNSIEDNIYLDLYINGTIVVLAFLTLLYVFRKQDEIDTENESSEHIHDVVNHSDEFKALQHKAEVAHKMLQQREIELQNTKHQLTQSQKYESIGKLASALVREFLKILNSIVGTAHILQRKIKSDEYLSVKVDTIIKQSIRGLDFSRKISKFTEENNSELSVKNINDIVSELQGVVDSIIGQDITFYLQESKEPLYAKVDVSRLLQALMNLIVNAKDAMPQGGDLHVLTEYVLDQEKQCWAKISVVDTGIGIRQDELNKIFTPSYTTKQNQNASGLGLDIVVNIVRAFKGKIEVKSKVGQGSRFDIFIPCTRSTGDSQNKINKKLLENNILLVDRSFLIIDNDVEEAKLIEKILKEYNGNVEICDNSADAIEIIRSGKIFDVVIIEIDLDDMDGIDLYQELDKINNELHVIFVSSVEEQRVAESIIHSDLTSFLAKPVQVEDIIIQVSGTLGIEPPEE